MPNDLRQQIVALIPALRTNAYAKTRSRSEADDLVQETLIRALRYLNSFQSGTNLKSWLYKIMLNCQRQEFLKQRNIVQDVDGWFAAGLATPASQEWSLQCADVATALLKLTPDARGALLLIAGEGISYEEAAARSNCAVGTLKSRVSRARERLAELTGRTANGLGAIERCSQAGQSPSVPVAAAFHKPTLRLSSRSPSVAPAIL